MGKRPTIEDVLVQARERILRLTPAEAAAAQRRGASIVDLRDAMDRQREGVIRGSLHVPLSVLPWRADPDSAGTDHRINDLNAELVLMCNDGFSSSLAAALLGHLGFTKVGDMIGGYRAWFAEGRAVAVLELNAE